MVFTRTYKGCWSFRNISLWLKYSFRRFSTDFVWLSEKFQVSLLGVSGDQCPGPDIHENSFAVKLGDVPTLLNIRKLPRLFFHNFSALALIICKKQWILVILLSPTCMENLFWDTGIFLMLCQIYFRQKKNVKFRIFVFVI